MWRRRLMVLGFAWCSVLAGASAAQAAGPGEACATGGDCDSGVCVAELCRAPACGDGVINGDEGCDDGQLDAQGDPAAPVAGDGCSAACAVESGYACSPNTRSGASLCAPDCGDGVVLAPETCDDGDTDPGDGCSQLCLVEPGFTCPAAGACEAICGDGRWAEGVEGCDDDNAEDGDGCSAACEVEGGWACDGESGGLSACASTCGDRTLDVGFEGCDDGDLDPGDGCDADCVVEGGWTCDDASPSHCTDDPDGDGVHGLHDNCPEVANADQANADTDPNGDACDDDDDDDGVLDEVDVCRTVPDPEQPDADGDGVGDLCEDGDGDGIPDRLDDCPDAANPGQEDADRDGVGDLCDPSPDGAPAGGCQAGAGASGLAELLLALALIGERHRRVFRG